MPPRVSIISTSEDENTLTVKFVLDTATHPIRPSIRINTPNPSVYRNTHPIRPPIRIHTPAPSSSRDYGGTHLPPFVSIISTSEDENTLIVKPSPGT